VKRLQHSRGAFSRQRRIQPGLAACIAICLLAKASLASPADHPTAPPEASLTYSGGSLLILRPSYPAGSSRMVLSREPFQATMPDGQSYDPINDTLQLDARHWAKFWRRALDGKVEVAFTGYAPFRVVVSPEAAWYLADQGTDDDRKAVADKFPNHPLTERWIAELEKAEAERKAMADACPGKIATAVDSRNAAELGRQIALAPSTDCETSALEGLKNVLGALKAKPVTPPHWVSVTEPTELFEGPGVSAEHRQDEDPEIVEPGTPIAHIANADRYALILFPATKDSLDGDVSLRARCVANCNLLRPAGEPVDGSLKELLAHLGALRWVPVAKTIDLAKWQADKEHMDQVHAEVGDTEFEQLVRAMAQLRASLSVPTYASQRNQWQVQLKQAKFFFCQTRAKLLKTVSAADLVRVAREICETVHEQSTDGGYAVEIPVAKCLTNVQKPDCP